MATIVGTPGNDTLDGTSGIDQIYGLAGDDIINGNGGDDTLSGGDGNDQMDGGSGNNTVIYYDASNSVTVNLSTGLATGQGNDTLINISNIGGSTHDDRLIGDNNNNAFAGGGGNDVMSGGGGNDIFTPSSDGNSIIDGGTGSNSLYYLNFTTGVNVDLSAGQATFAGPSGTLTDTISNIQMVYGSNFNDTLIGDNNDNAFLGGNGDDILQGGGGNDAFNPGLGNDQIDGGTGTNTVVYSFLNGVSGVNVDLGAGQATFTANSVAYTQTLANIQVVYGTSSNDVLVGDANSNALYGLGGNDTLQGGGGNDAITPGVGNSSIDGGSGINTLSYSSFDTGVNVDLSAGQITFTEGSGSYTQSVTNMQNVAGTAFNDTLVGDANDNSLASGGGVDIMQGGGGNDIFTPSTNDDNTINGGTGTNNALYYAGFDTGVNVDLLGGTASFTNASGTHTDMISNIQTVYGSQFTDTLTGNAASNIFYGNGGDDVMQGGGGNDYFVPSVGNGSMDGGPGVDSVIYSSFGTGVTVNLSAGQTTFTDPSGSYTQGLSSIENVYGSSFADTLVGNGANNLLRGGDGNDTLVVSVGSDVLKGDGGTDTLRYDGTSDLTVNLGNGTATDPTLTYNTVLDTIENATTGSGNDTLIGTSGDNVLMGRGGDDTLYVTTGIDTLDGGGGNNTVVVMGAADMTVNLSGATPSALGPNITTTLAFIQNITSGSGNDELTGNTDNNVISAGDGNDIIHATQGSDTIDGGSGNDTLIITPNGSGALASVTVDLSAATPLATGLNISSTLSNIENVTSGNGDDTLTGDSNDNVLSGGNGDDTLTGGGGNDTLLPGLGTNIIHGGLGVDTLDYSDVSLSNATISLEAGSTTMIKLGVKDTFSSIENITGSSSDDTIIGDANDNILKGGLGNDTIIGGAGNDQIDGGTGNDTVVLVGPGTIDLSTNTVTSALDGSTDTLTSIENATGSGGNDTLISDHGNNVLTGAGGDNKFVFGFNNGHDTITDFNTSSQDAIDLTAYHTSFTNVIFSTSDNPSGNAVIHLSPTDTITLIGVSTSSLSATDFIF